MKFKFYLLVLLYLGHRSNAVRSYKRTSTKQQMEVTDVLYGNGGSREMEAKKAKIAERDIEEQHLVGNKKICVNVNFFCRQMLESTNSVVENFELTCMKPGYNNV